LSRRIDAPAAHHLRHQHADGGRGRPLGADHPHEARLPLSPLSELRLAALRDGFERGAAVAADGSVRVVVQATPGDAGVLTWPVDELRGLDLVHSHPFEGLFSDTDMRALPGFGIRSISFITPQGTFGSLFAQDVDGFFAARDAFTRRVIAMLEVLGPVPAAERNLVLPHALGLWLDRSGVAAYHLNPTGALSDILSRHSELIERLIDEVHPA